MALFGRKRKPAKRCFWAAAWISGGALLTAYLPYPISGSVVPSAGASEELVGLNEQRAIELLGPPATTENRAPATIWNYKSSRCELTLVFYMEMRTGLMRALHYDFKSGADNAAQRKACLTSIAQENSEGAAGNRWPEKDMAAEAPSVNEFPPAAAETSTQNAVSAVSAPKQQPSRREARREARVRRIVRHRPHWYAARDSGWRYALALRSGWPSNPAAVITGWGSGQFGPPPYSVSGP